MSLNYSKWDNLVDSDDELESGAQTRSPQPSLLAAQPPPAATDPFLLHGGRASYFPSPASLFARLAMENDELAALCGSYGTSGLSTPLPVRATAALPSNKKHFVRKVFPSGAIPTYKLLLVGDGGVGKTAFVKRHTTGEFQKGRMPQSKYTVHPLRFMTNMGPLQFDVWDFSGDEVFDADDTKLETPQGGIRFLEEGGHCKGADAAILMFDVTNRRSYANVPNWYEALQEGSCARPGFRTVLVGNKMDVKDRKVKMSQINFHRKHNLQYYDVSVKARYNDHKPFLSLARYLSNSADMNFVDEHTHYRVPARLAVLSCLARLREMLYARGNDKAAMDEEGGGTKAAVETTTATQEQGEEATTTNYNNNIVLQGELAFDVIHSDDLWRYILEFV